MIVIDIVLLLLIVYLLLLRGRRDHPGLSALRGYFYAHRGLHGNGVPENSLEAFRLAVNHGYGAELDVHLMADGNLAVIHDSSLKRTAGADIKIEDLTVSDLLNYPLEGTAEIIPLLRQVLDLFEEKTPLIIELKTSGNNHAALCQAVCRMLDGYQGAFCLESFDPRCIRWLKVHRPELIRGQLSENFMGDLKFPLIGRIAMSFLLTNFWNRPDFIAYKFADRKNISVAFCQKIWGIQCVAWTLRSKEVLDEAVRENWLPIFEKFIP